jgi:hypothetical protein
MLASFIRDSSGNFNFEEMINMALGNERSPWQAIVEWIADTPALNFLDESPEGPDLRISVARKALEQAALGAAGIASTAWANLLLYMYQKERDLVRDWIVRLLDAIQARENYEIGLNSRMLKADTALHEKITAAQQRLARLEQIITGAPPRPIRRMGESKDDWLRRVEAWQTKYGLPTQEK